MLMNFGEPGFAVTPSTVRGSAGLAALPLPAPPSASVTGGQAKILFYNLFQAKSFTRRSHSNLDCPCIATEMKPQQIRSRLGFRGQCRPLVKRFFLASIAVTRRTTGINNDLTTRFSQAETLTFSWH